MSNKKPAGLTHAPEYDSTQDVDDSKVETIPEQVGFDVHKLAYYQELERKRAHMTKSLLFVLMFLLIAVVMILISTNSRKMTENMVSQTHQLQLRLNDATMERGVVIDQLEQANVQDTLDEILERLEAIETSISAEATD